VRPGAAIAGELEHLRAERREAAVLGGHLERVEEGSHRRERLAPALPDERAVAHAQSEEHAGLVTLGDGGPPRVGVLGCLLPDVEDTGGDRDRGGRRQEDVEGAEQVAADVGDPDRDVAQGFELSGGVRDRSGIAVAEGSRPDARARDRIRHGQMT